MKISTKPLPAALSGIAMVPFTTFRIIDVINVLRYSSMLAIGGTDGSTVSRTVYVSNDYGMAWAEGGSLIQLPDYMPAVHGAQAFVEDETLTASRATRPITEWQCPYIYLFGGTRPDEPYQTPFGAAPSTGSPSSPSNNICPSASPS